MSDDTEKAGYYYDLAALLYNQSNTDNKPAELYYYSIWTDKNDEQTYKTVRIGSQVWMANNLKTDSYNDGTPILGAYNFDDFSNENGAYCWYQFDSSRYEMEYGKLYNWYVVKTGKLCPGGWHVPSKKEWEELESFLLNNRISIDYSEEQEFKIGGLIKESGTKHWERPNTGATNESGFTALPGGFSDTQGGTNFANGTTYGIWRSVDEAGWYWTSTPSPDRSSSGRQQAFVLSLSYKSTQFWLRDIPYVFGCSVRCIKD